MNRFIITANIEASDGGTAIIAGNERVIRARLSDAKFFYEADLKNWKSKSTDELLQKFDQIVFHEKLGTQAERIARIVRLAAEIAPLVGADVEKTKQAAALAKADLLTEVVGEFPELQGLMGKYYALAQGADASVAAASEDHYKPQGPADRVPTDPISIAVALADKLDTLVGFWAIDEKPTGSKDPFALRRAALGVIRLLTENSVRLDLWGTSLNALYPFVKAKIHKMAKVNKAPLVELASRIDVNPILRSWEQSIREQAIEVSDVETEFAQALCDNLLSFFADRLKGQLREQGSRHDLVDAVFSLGGQDDLLMVVRRVEALGKFLDTDDGKNLRAGVKRASNILGIEEKKDKRAYDGAPEPSLYKLDEEKALAKAIAEVGPEASSAVAREDFAGAMTAMAKLRPAVDAFFDKVKVNDDDAAVRENRLKLLNEIRAATRAVADFSKIQD